MFKPDQIISLAQLSLALRECTLNGALDQLQGHLSHPDSINDVCDAVRSVLEPRDPPIPPT